MDIIGDILKTDVVCYLDFILMDLVGTAAGEQCFGQCKIMGSEDCVCGWYPFD